MNASANRTSSYWSESASMPWLCSLQRDLNVDVAVVGAGITGLTTAALLKQAGKRVAVLEAGEFGTHGTTHRTSAHLTAVLDMGFTALVRKFSVEQITTAVAASMAAIDRIDSLASELSIESEFRRVDGYRYCETADQVEALEDDAEAAGRVGLNVRLTREVPLPFQVARGYRVANQGQFHPMKHLAGLAHFVNGDGSFVFDGTRVENVDAGEPCHVQTDSGVVTASKVVLATHTPIGLWLSLHPRLVPYRSYVMAVRAAAPIAPALFWDTADPYHYIRTVDTPSGQLLIIGGADHKTGHCEDHAERFEDLERFIRARFDVRSIEHRWSSEFFEPSDGLPYIGHSPTSSHVFVATGFSGTGLTFGTVAAMLISDQILGRVNPWADLFTPNRFKPLASMGRTLAEAGATLKGLVVDRVRGGDGSDVDDLRPGEGRVISQRGERLAVYRDEQMRLHVHSASCPHMGCIVAWNNAEQTWDCPCHGSCFRATGEVVHGPATASLATRELREPATPQAASHRS